MSSVPQPLARVILDVPLGELDYKIPEGMTVAAGDRVVVPLGPRRMVGVVTAVSGTSAVEEKKLRSICTVLSGTGPLRAEWMEFTRFAAGYYLSTWGQAALPALPLWLRRLPTPRTDGALEKLQELPKKKTARVRAPRIRPEQSAAVEAISGAAGFEVFVLFGVTGSGKTEVYLRVMKERLAADPEAQVLLLVPEINLTPQLEAGVRGRLADEAVVTLHSRLSQGERARSWLAVHEGRARVLVGTRLAIFASFRKLALVIVDEEHDPSYRAGDGLRFSARDLAVKRAMDNRVPCILGSATPSLETWARVQSGSYRCLEMRERANEKAHLPVIELVDMRKKPGVIFADETLRAVNEALARKEQALIFINRRGYAPAITCCDCGWVRRCDHCSGLTVFHKAERALVCHHCGTSYPVPAACPSCGSANLEVIGSGTQRLEEAVEEQWPDARVLRIDADTTRAKGKAAEAFRRVHAGDVDIVVGTQMISKGHDFQKVSLVVVLNADGQLFSQDLRAEERLFATLMQVAGRAGRGDSPGRVLIQTRFVDHPLYEALLAQSFEMFAGRLLEERREASSPPFCFQALLMAESRTLARALGFLRRAKDAASALQASGVSVYDPVPMALVRLMDVERAQLLLESTSRRVLHHFLKKWMGCMPEAGGVRWRLIVDPAEV